MPYWHIPDATPDRDLLWLLSDLIISKLTPTSVLILALENEFSEINLEDGKVFS